MTKLNEYFENKLSAQEQLEVQMWLAASGASWYALRIMSRTGNDPAALLGVILGFFGGELL